MLTELALRRRAAVLLGLALLVAGGLSALGQLKRELFPDVALPIVTIVTMYPGADPSAVADQVSKPIEDAIAGTEGLVNLESTSEANVSVVVAQYAYGTSMDEATADVTEKVAALALPAGAERPRVEAISLDEIPALRLSLVAQEGGEAATLRRVAEKVIVPALTDVSAVQRVALTGGGDRQLVVALDAEKLAAGGLSPGAVAAALRANNVAVPAGQIQREGKEVQVRVRNELASLEAVSRLPLPRLGVAAGGQQVAGQGSAVGSGVAPAGGSQFAAAQNDPAQAAAAPVAAELGQRSYEVRPGDTLAGIARRFFGDERAWRRLVAANPSLADNPSLIKPGLKLVIPTGQGGQATVPPVQSAAPGGAGQTSLTIGDLGTLRWEEATTAGISRTNGRPSVGVLVYTRKGSDLIAAVTETRRRLEELRPRLAAEGAELVTIVDQSTYIRDSLGDLARDASWGGLLAVLVIVLFLFSLRSTLVIAVSIPTSLLLTFLMLSWRGMSLNMMTLGGLAVSTGRLVDDAIVVLEAVYRHRRQGKTPLAAARDGTREVGGAVIASTLTAIVVFAPLAMVGGVVGEFFRPFALTASLALLASLMVSLTVIPVLGSLLLRDDGGRGHGGWLREGYTAVIAWALRRRALTLAVAAGITLGSALLLGRIDRTFLPTAAEKVLQVWVAMEAGTSTAETAAASKPVEEVLANDPAVETFLLTVGDGGSLIGATGFGLSSTARADLFVRLRPDADVELVRRRLQGELERLQSPAKITVAPLESQGAPDGRLELVLTGGTSDELARAAADVTAALARNPHLADLRSDLAEAHPEVAVDVDAERAAAKGLTPAQVALAVRGIIAGEQAGTVEVDGRPANVAVKVEASALDDVAKLSRLTIGGPPPVTLGDVATVRQADGPVRIVRHDRQEAVTVTGTITTANTGAVNAEVERTLAEINLPAGVKVKVGGVIADMTEGFASLGTALIAAVGLVYLTMVITMDSLVVPLVVLASLPLAGVGAVAALFLSGRPLGMSALIGLLMLIGIVVTNAIVLLDRVRQLRESGHGVEEALSEAGRTRVRPILMTALTTILGLVPLAAGLGEGTLFAQEMATVVIGGLLTSTALTLVVVPVIYSLAQRFGGSSL